MKAKIIIFIMIILLIGGIFFFNKTPPKKMTHQLEYGGVVWPRNITYEVDKEGDISIEIHDRFDCYNGIWPAGTRFLFSGSELSKIIPAVPFEFAELKFRTKVEIEFEEFPPHLLHIFSIKEDITIDGLDLKSGCKLEFKDLTLYAGHCDSFGTVYFKRSVELPENAINQE